MSVITAIRYHRQVIRSFRNRDAQNLFARIHVRRWPSDVQRSALRKLRMLDAAQVLDDLRIPPGNHLERLKGERAGEYSIRIDDQWRVCFRWRASDAYDVEIVDYH